MVLEGSRDLTIIIDVNGSSTTSAFVTELGESIDGRDDDACKVSTTSEAVSNATNECKRRPDDCEAEEEAENGVNQV